MVSDEQIIEGCIEGKRKAFNLLYRKYSPALLGVCMRYSNSRADAEDILQEGLIKIFTRIRNYRGEGSFEGWMKKIMINTAIDHYQHHLKLHFQGDAADLPDDGSLPDQVAEEPELPGPGEISREILMGFVQELPDGYRMVFNLYALEGMGHREIADRLSISENTSKTQLMKARRSLRNKIARWMQQANALKR